MPKFTVQNFSGARISVGIEPWADQEFLDPHDVLEFDYDEPAEVWFGVHDDGIGVDVVSNRVAIKAKEHVKVHGC